MIFFDAGLYNKTSILSENSWAIEFDKVLINELWVLDAVRNGQGKSPSFEVIFIIADLFYLYTIFWAIILVKNAAEEH